jgi:hypothetical protein
MTTFNHEITAQIGDTIRSYDFQPMEGRGQCFVEGIVINKHDFMYEIAVQKRVWDDELEAVQSGETVQTPWSMVMGEYEDRITKLEVV